MSVFGSMRETVLPRSSIDWRKVREKMQLTWICFGLCTAVVLYNTLWQLSRLGMPWARVMEGIPFIEWLTWLCCVVAGIFFLQALPTTTSAMYGYSVLFLFGTIASVYVIWARFNDPIMNMKRYPENARGWKVCFGFAEFFNGNYPVPGINKCNGPGFVHFQSGYCSRHRQSLPGKDRQRVRVYVVISAKSSCTPGLFEAAKEQKLRAIDQTLNEVVDEDITVIRTNVLGHATEDEHIITVVKEITATTSTEQDTVIYKPNKK